MSIVCRGREGGKEAKACSEPSVQRAGPGLWIAVTVASGRRGGGSHSGVGAGEGRGAVTVASGEARG